MRRAALAVGIVIVGLVAGTIAIGRTVVLGQTAASAAAGDRPTTTRLVPVVRTTLVATQPVSGRVGASQSWTIVEPGGSTAADVVTAREGVAAATDRLSVARRSLTDARRTRDLVAAQDRAAVGAVHGTARLQASRTAQLNRLAQDETVAQAEVTAGAAARDLAAAQRELLAKSRTESRGGGIVTAIPSAGDVVDRGQSLVAIDGDPTILVIGATPMYRALREGETGPDVAELQANLAALGFGGRAGTGRDGVFDTTTTAAVRRWQAALGLDQTGVVRLGDVVVLPTSVRISAAHVVLGAAAASGAPLLDVASSEEVVSMQVDPGLGRLLHAGDAIRLEVPDGSTVPGTITSVGAPAVPPAADGGGGAQGGGSSGAPVTTVVAGADDPQALASLDGAAVRADITTGTAPDALAVPVNALVVLADGGFGVEVASGGSTQYVRVQPGIYDRTMVEIRADGLNPGDQVVVPAA